MMIIKASRKKIATENIDLDPTERPVETARDFVLVPFDRDGEDFSHLVNPHCSCFPCNAHLPEGTRDKNLDSEGEIV
jgi:hypothetical protein